MVHVVNTIVPVFAIIVLGWALRSRKFLAPDLINPLNRLVYYLAIPAMIFREVAHASFQANFDPLLLAGTMAPLVIIFFGALGLIRVYAIPRGQSGTFMQSAFHGNLAYIGLAVCYYFLGKGGFASASILAGFLMLLQNLLAVIGLQLFSDRNRARHGVWFFIGKIVGNPVILSALAGIIFSVWQVLIPEVFDRALKIIGGMALPLALLVIGASLSFDLVKSHLRLGITAGLLKLLGLPALGLLLYQALGIPSGKFLPGIILLAAPTATLTYVMAGEMSGSTDLASAAVSLNTLLSAATFIFWLVLLA